MSTDTLLGSDVESHGELRYVDEVPEGAPGNGWYRSHWEHDERDWLTDPSDDPMVRFLQQPIKFLFAGEIRRGLVTVDANAPWRTNVAGTMLEQRVGAVVLLDGQGRAAQIFTDRDAAVKGPWQLDDVVGNLATPGVVTLDLRDPVAYLVKFLALDGIRHVVITRKGLAIAMVSARDVLRVIYERLGSNPYFTGRQVCHLGSSPEDAERRSLLVVGPDTMMKCAAKTMRDLRGGAVRVFGPADELGLLAERDLLRAMYEGVSLDDTPVHVRMSRNLISAGEKATIAEVMRLMIEHHIRHLIVGDRIVVQRDGIYDLARACHWIYNLDQDPSKALWQNTCHG